MESCPLLPADWEIPNVLRYRLGHGPGRQRALDFEDHLLLVLHAVPKPHDRQRTGCIFWRQPDGVWRSASTELGQETVDQHLRRYSEALDKLESTFEAANDSTGYFRVLASLGALGRSTRNMYAALQEARKLYKEDQELLNWRDTAYGLVRQVELLQSDAQGSLDFEIARQAEVQAMASHQMATSAHRLNVLAAFFFPVITLSAVFGVGLQDGFTAWNDSKGGFGMAIMLVLGLVFGIALTALITRPVQRPEPKSKKKELE